MESWARTLQLTAWLLLIGSMAYGLTRLGGAASDDDVRTTSDRLLDLPFAYQMMDADRCRVPPFFAAVVHSKPQHFRQRQVIRRTWASSPLVRVVFLVGVVGDEPSAAQQRPYPMDTQALLNSEHAKYADLVQGNFVDHYHNLTYKNLMGLKWASEHCAEATYVLKADDDAFVDVEQLRRLLLRSFGTPASSSSAPSASVAGEDATLACSVQPDGGRVQRTGKWAASRRQYAGETYPAFCSGLAYVLKPSLARRLLDAADAVPFFWIDDVYVTGLVARAAGVRHFYLNLRYTHDAGADLASWLADDAPSPMPYLVAEIDTSSDGVDWRPFVERIWNKTLSAHAHQSPS